MMDLEILVDETMPPHAVYCTVSGDEMRVHISPRVEPAVLEVLDPEVADYVRNRP